jgi:hypothetical protein
MRLFTCLILAGSLVCAASPAGAQQTRDTRVAPPLRRALHQRLVANSESADRAECIRKLQICQQSCSSLYGEGSENWLNCRKQCGNIDLNCPDR